MASRKVRLGRLPTEPRGSPKACPPAHSRRIWRILLMRPKRSALQRDNEAKKGEADEGDQCQESRVRIRRCYNERLLPKLSSFPSHVA
jgi:hypothetical protein